MANYFDTSHNTDNPSLQGSILRGISGGLAGMFVCTLALFLCCLCQAGQLTITLQLFVGLAIGGFYRLFRGRRSKTAAYVIVGICTALTCVLWIVIFALLSVVVSQKSVDWERLWRSVYDLLPLCAGIGLFGFIVTRRSLLAYADWKKGPWHIAYAYAGGASYNLLPQTLPAAAPPACFAVHSRFAPGTGIIIEGSDIRQRRRIRKDRVFSVDDIAGVVLGPSGGCNVLYDKNYQVLAKFAGSMEHADLLFAWLIQRNIPMDRVPAGWRSPDSAGP